MEYIAGLDSYIYIYIYIDSELRDTVCPYLRFLRKYCDEIFQIT